MACPGRPNCGGGNSSKGIKASSLPTKKETPVQNTKVLLNGVVYVPKR